MPLQHSRPRAQASPGSPQAPQVSVSLQQASDPQQALAPDEQSAPSVAQQDPPSHPSLQQSASSRHTQPSGWQLAGRHSRSGSQDRSVSGSLQQSVIVRHLSPMLAHAHTPSRHWVPGQQSASTPQLAPASLQLQTPSSQRRSSQQSASESQV
jgi:hypothetical protein